MGNCCLQLRCFVGGVAISFLGRYLKKEEIRFDMDEQMARREFVIESKSTPETSQCILILMISTLFVSSATGLQRQDCQPSQIC